MNIIETTQLTKFYGRHRGIEGLDLEVREGEIFGFVGPNGAGKSTTIRILVGLLFPTRGSAHVLGMDVVRRAGRSVARSGTHPRRRSTTMECVCTSC
jgi:ABC-2 type transport system ATP-binding protein